MELDAMVGTTCRYLVLSNDTSRVEKLNQRTYYVKGQVALTVDSQLAVMLDTPTVTQGHPHIIDSVYVCIKLIFITTTLDACN